MRILKKRTKIKRIVRGGYSTGVVRFYDARLKRYGGRSIDVVVNLIKSPNKKPKVKKTTKKRR